MQLCLWDSRKHKVSSNAISVCSSASGFFTSPIHTKLSPQHMLPHCRNQFSISSSSLLETLVAVLPPAGVLVDHAGTDGGLSGAACAGVGARFYIAGGRGHHRPMVCSDRLGEASVVARHHCVPGAQDHRQLLRQETGRAISNQIFVPYSAL